VVCLALSSEWMPPDDLVSADTSRLGDV
jgi:hypothetical protein